MTLINQLAGDMSRAERKSCRAGEPLDSFHRDLALMMRNRPDELQKQFDSLLRLFPSSIAFEKLMTDFSVMIIRMACSALSFFCQVQQ
jgi:hypothetical protein